MNNIPPIDLEALHVAMKSAFQASFSGVAVDYYSRPGETVAVPAIFFELESIEPDQALDTGSQQANVMLRFSADCITSYKAGGKLNARLLAASVAALVQRNKFGLPVTPGRFTGSIREHFHTDDTAYESWSVKWTHSAAFSSDLWNTTGSTVVNGFAGLANITTGNVAGYDQLLPDSTRPTQ